MTTESVKFEVRTVVSKPHRKDIRPVLSDEFGIKVTDIMIDEFLRAEEACNWTEKLRNFLVSKNYMASKNVEMEAEMEAAEKDAIEQANNMDDGVGQYEAGTDMPATEERQIDENVPEECFAPIDNSGLNMEISSTPDMIDAKDAEGVEKYKVNLATKVGSVNSVTIYQEVINEIKTQFGCVPMHKDCIREVIAEIEPQLADSTLAKKTNAYTKYMVEAGIIDENEHKELVFTEQ